jgi:hypothetical protein
MLLNTAPQDTAVLSNVGQIGEFRIRNSAKAFGILSSGLYANKIRAIVRELSCNAYDSHVAANCADTPFDVHLPSSLEPWFSIRDYGVGLNEDQVTNIYTTYFESTKTDSNDFIGALGLGSKSPFSYTDNFTVTTIKDGVKGIYSAFINEHGVPSIAQMMSASTDECNGVEIKFSVNDYSDYYAFKTEAEHVYTRFATTPNVTGGTNFSCTFIKYADRDIIPGVHLVEHHNSSMAVMGNIAYPIEIPDSEKMLGDLQKLLKCGLEIHFKIGQLDFQASREGLSYIPSTVNAIKDKLQRLKISLDVNISKQADAIENLWDRANFLNAKSQSSLWTESIHTYISRTKLPTVQQKTSAYFLQPLVLCVADKEIAENFNIVITGLNYDPYYATSSTIKKYMQHTNVIKVDQTGNDGYNSVIICKSEIVVDASSIFVENNTTVGAIERTRYHLRTEKNKKPAYLYVLDKADKSKDMDLKGFYESIYGPNPNSITQVSKLLKKEKSVKLKNISLLKMQKYSYRNDDSGWVAADSITDMADASTTYYYLPLKGYEVQSKYEMSNAKHLKQMLQYSGMPELNVDLYGVRKSDIETIKKLPNWINIEDLIAKELAKPGTDKLFDNLIADLLDNYTFISYNSDIVNTISSDSLYRKFLNQIKTVNRNNSGRRNSGMYLSELSKIYSKDNLQGYHQRIQEFKIELDAILNHYPLLTHLSYASVSDTVHYINLIDKTQGV